MLHRSITTRVALAAAAAALTLPAAAASAATKTQYYVSVGDSYASSYQPSIRNGAGTGSGSNTRNGFADQLPRFAAKRGYKLKLVNFGCGGATTSSIINDPGCPPGGLALNSPGYAGLSQATAVASWLKAHKRSTALVTVSIGGNDVTACGRGDADPVACVTAAVGGINTNVKALLTKLRKAAGPKVRIVGITYPDVILGEYLNGDAGKQLAGLSQIAFKSLINPALKQQYEAVGGRFVDVTQATGGYGSFDATVSRPDLSPDPVPANVAAVCDITFYCQAKDIHPKTGGYTQIAQLVAATLPKRKR